MIYMFSKEKFKKELYNNFTQKTYEREEFFQKNIQLKKNFYYKLKNIVAIVIVGILFGTVGYAAYQTLRKTPNYNWLGDSIKFNDNYEKFSVDINEKIAETDNNSKIILETINYDGGYAVFEMTALISQEDKDFLELGKSIFNDVEIEKFKSEDISFYTNRMNNYDNSLNISKEEYIEDYQKKIEEINRAYEISRTLTRSFELQNAGIVTGLRSKQNVQKISDDEYKIYYYYFITDEDFGEDGKFTVVLNNMRLLQTFDKDRLDFEKFYDMSIAVDNKSVEKNKSISLNGKFEYTFAQNKSSKWFKPNIAGIEYDILTQYIDSIRVTPMQTVIRIKSKFTGIKNHTLATTINDWNDPELIGMLGFNIYDDNMNKIKGLKVQSKRDVIFEDGHIESWDECQAGPKYPQNSPLGQNMEIVDYIIVSNEDYKDKIYIYPTREEHYANRGKTYEVEFERGYTIDFKNIEERQTDEIQRFEHIEVDNTRKDNMDDTIIIPITMPK